MKNRLRINVKGTDGETRRVFEAAEGKLPSRILRFLFGDFTNIYLMKPGEAVDSVDIVPVKEEDRNETV